MAKKSSLKEFINKSKIIHNNKYDYSKFEYINNSIRSDILCIRCNAYFKQSPNSHLRGSGCPCNKIYKKPHNNKEIWVNKVRLKHGNRYDYTDSIYTGYNKKISIKCKEHGVFIQNARFHMAGAGCPKCGITGFKKKAFCQKYEMAYLYIIKCWNENEEFYKIGITGKGTKERFHVKSKMPYNYELVDEIYYFSDPIWEYEKDFHTRFKKDKYKPKIKFSGSTECFNTNIEKEIYDLRRNEEFA